MKKWLMALVWLVCLLMIVPAAYVGYVWFSYSRIEDGRALEVASAREAPLPVDRPLSAMTMNVGFGAYDPAFSFFMDGGRYARALSRESVERLIDGSASILREKAPDIALLQEVDLDADRSHHVDQRARITGALADYGSVYAVNYDSAYLFYPFQEPTGRTKAGMLTLSKYRIDSARRLSLPIEGGFAKLIDLDRCMSVCRLPVENDRYLTLIHIHPSAYVRDAAVLKAQKDALMGALGEAVAAGDYVICGGDFNNDLHGGGASRLFGFEARDEAWLKPFDEAALPEGLRLIAPSNAPTVRDTAAPYAPGQTFVSIVDGFVVSDDVEVREITTLDKGFTYSDHNPVLLSFSLKP